MQGENLNLLGFGPHQLRLMQPGQALEKGLPAAAFLPEAAERPPLAALAKELPGPGLCAQPGRHLLRLGQIALGPGQRLRRGGRGRQIRRGGQNIRKTAMPGSQGQEVGADRLLPEFLLGRSRAGDAHLLQGRAQGRNLGLEAYQHGHVARRQAVVQFSGVGAVLGLVQKSVGRGPDKPLHAPGQPAGFGPLVRRGEKLQLGPQGPGRVQVAASAPALQKILGHVQYVLAGAVALSQPVDHKRRPAGPQGILALARGPTEAVNGLIRVADAEKSPAVRRQQGANHGQLHG